MEDEESGAVAALPTLKWGREGAVEEAAAAQKPGKEGGGVRISIAEETKGADGGKGGEGEWEGEDKAEDEGDVEEEGLEQDPEYGED